MLEKSVCTVTQASSAWSIKRQNKSTFGPAHDFMTKGNIMSDVCRSIYSNYFCSKCTSETDSAFNPSPSFPNLTINVKSYY